MDIQKKDIYKNLDQRELLKERLKGILIGISLEKCGKVEEGSTTDYLDTITSTEGSELFGDDPTLMELLKDIEWSKEESKNISELILKKDCGKTKKI